MVYLLDGYNILFFYKDTQHSFSKTRELLVSFLQKKFKERNLSGFLIFDGAHRRDEESGRNYANPLEIIYTPKGQNADSYILEKIKAIKNPKEATLVTNDRGLIRQAQSHRVLTQSVSAFFQFLEKKSRKDSVEKKRVKDSPQNEARLLKEFLSRLEDL